jgi:hypothetical protein
MTVKVTKPALNLREKLSELDKPSGIAGQDILKADTPQEVFNYINAGRRNLIINGGFQVSQRGDYTTASSVTHTEHTLDRWKHLVQVVTTEGIHTRRNTVNGETVSTWKQYATSSATGRFAIRQYIESDGATQLSPTAGKPATLSVWMKSNSSLAGIFVYDYCGGGYQGNGVNHSGSGEWEYLTFTFTSGTTVTSSSQLGYGLELNFGIHTPTNGNVQVTSGDYVEIAQPQLEVGSVATPFEHRSYGEELALCQRYYWQVTNGGISLGFGAGSISYIGVAGGAANYIVGNFQQHPVTMRASPTVTQTNVAASNCTNRDIIASIYGFVNRVDVTAAGRYRVSADYYVDAEL